MPSRPALPFLPWPAFTIDCLARLMRQVEAVLDALTIRSLESDVERVYAAVRVALERKATPIGAHDMLIAAHAKALDAVCVTDNIAEFKRVPALKVENWIR